MSTFRTSALAIAASLVFVALSPVMAAAQESSKVQPSNVRPPETGIAACYSRHLVGHRTTSGKRYNPNLLTAAHSTIPEGTHVKVTNLDNGKSVVVLVNDHMSPKFENHHGRLPTRLQTIAVRPRRRSQSKTGSPTLNPRPVTLLDFALSYDDGKGGCSVYCLIR
jgi:hypothetical protein